ncbi:RidA family protein [Actinoplanes xinjiangensis]|jgi:enamine deaminase RidA (YjgF/YER057c/UK114 family)|uniref:Enamine deaminase RidA (YjgF/YER057c/UK114 family) n=1 Tax=Actinoplanes xinjiangensis TaxID=512350 RepID=A0A316FUL4_9ACTN|nr:RidA family protein [Actinoplanes xinjiangensis]PWK52278.1 enamine deaminase RidA (YjgF/YER057c/UK114 family) [Actinoplanes xinjiangensis]GIF37020.1 enamine deaminase RidA [Actinoplanes xinjiangensis]
MAIIEFPEPPSPNGYSHTVVVAPGSRLVYISGQVPVDADGRVPEGWADQTRLTFRNVEAALAAGGAGWADVIKLTYFVTGTGELPAIRRIRDEFVDTARPPASSLVQVAGLFRPDVLIEIEAVAAVPA